MSTDKTPRDADETLALPVPDHQPSPPTAPADADPADTVVISDADTTALTAHDPAVRASDDTASPASGDTASLPSGDTASLPSGHTAGLASDDSGIPAADDDARPAPYGNAPGAEETAVPVPDDTRAVPVTEETRLSPSTSAWSSQDEPAGYTSPIGVLYAPTDRPGPAPSDRVVPDPAVEPSPVIDPPHRRLRVGTVVWGLVIAAIGVGLLAWAAGFAIDLQLAMIVLLAVAGTALLVGSIISGARASRR